jgi:hypothetical protein
MCIKIKENYFKTEQQQKRERRKNTQKKNPLVLCKFFG